MTDINSLLIKFASARSKIAGPYPVSAGDADNDGIYDEGARERIPIGEMSARNLLPFGIPAGNQEGFNLGEILGLGGLGYLGSKFLRERFTPGGLFRRDSYNPREAQNIANLKPGPAQSLMARYLSGPAAGISVTPTTPGGTVREFPLTIEGKNVPVTADARAAELMRPPPPRRRGDSPGNPVRTPGLPGGGGITPSTPRRRFFGVNAPGAKVEMALPPKAFEGTMGALYRVGGALSDSRMPSPAIRPRTFLGGLRTVLPSRLGGVRGGSSGPLGLIAGLALPAAYNAFMSKPENFDPLSSQQNLSGQPIIPK